MPEFNKAMGLYLEYFDDFVKYLKEKYPNDDLYFVKKGFQNTDYLIMAAAVADFRPIKMSEQKIEEIKLEENGTR